MNSWFGNLISFVLLYNNLRVLVFIYVYVYVDMLFKIINN